MLFASLLDRDSRFEEVCWDREKLITLTSPGEEGSRLEVCAPDSKCFNSICLEIELSEGDVFSAHAEGGLKMYVEDIQTPPPASKEDD